MTEDDLAFLRDFLRQRSGLSLGPEKRYLVESRLSPLARAAGLPDVAAVVAALRIGRDKELARAVVDAMATHETLFFRDRLPFDVMRDLLLPQLNRSLPPGRPLRIWSAAASTGQEAYSIAILVREMAVTLAGRSVEIVASDISEAAIERARAGTYSQFEVQRGLPIRNLLDSFVRLETGWEIRPHLRRMVEFRVFNLLDDLAPLGRFDIILCRNLLIYLDRPGKERLLAKLAGALAPDGALCLGGAESALGLSGTLVPHPGAPGFFLAAQDQRRRAALPSVPAVLAAEPAPRPDGARRDAAR